MDRQTAKSILLASLPQYLAQKGIQVNRNFLCLNPEHNDHTPSMTYNRHRNKCHCFACGADADIFDLIEWDYGASGFAEAFRIGCDLFGLDVGDQTAEKKMAFKKAAPANSNRKTGQPLLPLTVYDKVYRAMQSVSPLTEQDIRYLKEVRGLPEDRIKKGYMRMVMDEKGRKEVIRKIKKITGLKDGTLRYVPGFFIDKYTGELDYVGDKTRNYDPGGIGILIHNVDGLVTAIQIRHDTKQKSSRYAWFSSSFMKDGCSPGSAKDVLIPECPKTCLCITEGRFKSELLAKQRNITISIQGVSSWRGIDKDIETLKQRYQITSIYLFFDSDILGNRQVFCNIRDLASMLRHTFPELNVRFALWPIACGKGIDDCFLAGNAARVQFLEAKDFLPACERVFQEVLKQMHLTDARHAKGQAMRNLKKLSVEEQKQFKQTLQKAEEHAFFAYSTSKEEAKKAV